jgi:hypothetical protein
MKICSKHVPEFPFGLLEENSHGRRISCLPAPLPLSRIQHHCEEQKADIRHLSEREEQGFHIPYQVSEPEVESGGDFQFLYP